MDMETVVREAANAIESTGNARAVFGDPIKLDTHVIVPVAAVLTGVGLGGGQSVLLGAGGGGGVDLKVVPLGYIHETDEGIEFTRIEVPELDRILEAAERGRGKRRGGDGDGKRQSLSDQIRSRIGR